MKLPETGYYRQPALAGDDLIFVCESDLWRVSIEGGLARRLTAHQVDAYWPQVSPDGLSVAFSAVEEGSMEVYLMPAEGGHAERLTFQGSANNVTGFTPDGTRVVYASVAELPFQRQPRLWTVPVTGGAPTPLPIGPARRISYARSGGVVISRREQEIARWKRYRGGTRGDLWVDATGNGEFREILTDFQGNLGSPCFVEGRIYFVADHEGHGNVYSCLPDGSDMRRCTDHDTYYARALNTDGRRLTYQCGGEIYILEPQTGPNAKPRQVQVRVNSTRPQLTRRFVSAARYLQGYRLHPAGHSLLVNTRGKPYVMGNWEREVTQLGERDGVRYRFASWLGDGKRVVAVSDAGGEEALEILSLPGETGERPEPVRLADLDTGRIVGLAVSPTKDAVVFGNHRCEVVHVDLTTGKLTVLDRSEYDTVSALRWSPDGRWVAYAARKALPYAQIFVADTVTGEARAVTRIVGDDSMPAFDPDGKYLYFLSARVFDPVYDSIRFDLGFPKGVRPYLVTLRKDVESPFHPRPRPLEKGKDASPKDKDKDKDKDGAKSAPAAKAADSAEETQEPKDAVPPVLIDFDGIEDRILEFPVAEGRYRNLAAVKGKIFYSETPVEGSLGKSWSTGDKTPSKLWAYDLETLKTDVFAEGLESFVLSQDGKTIAFRSSGKLRVVKTSAKPDLKDAKPGRASGVIDLDRVRVSLMPAAEWRQMFREMWRLQRDHFWTTDLSQVDWPEVYERYLPILDKVATRAEFSDLAWEVQGELGTSHAYEMGGDLKLPPAYSVGKLGADLAWDGESYVIGRLVRGDSWDRVQDSPLAEPGLGIEVGDRLVAVDDQPLTKTYDPGQALVHKAGVDVALTVRSPSSGKQRRVVVRPLGTDVHLRYRAWVEANRARVHAETAGRIGYVHVPDMGPRGYAEFFRYFTQESYLSGLVVDVRFNGGGHVSQFLLEKLMRRRISYMVSHHMRPFPEPHYSVEGPIVALTNEHAGSDGDIFSHSFKLLKLGTLIGKRTWGGVIGIDGRNTLVDGTVVTQPEYSTWFKDVGWSVENYGTDPDIEVDIKPQDYARGDDPQLARAIQEALAALAKNPPSTPDFGRRPHLGRRPKT